MASYELLGLNEATPRAVAPTAADTGVVTNISVTANAAVGGTLGVTGAATLSSTLGVTGAITNTAGTANGVVYLNESKVQTSGTAIKFDGASLGVGVTPNTWVSSLKAVQIGAGAAIFGHATIAGNAYFSANLYYDGADRYIGTGLASKYQQEAGVHSWSTAPSGTVGNAITFVQAMGLSSTALTMNVPITLKGYTVATLPAGVSGDKAYVTDATAPAYNTALTGGGAVVVPVFKNATVWVSC